MRYNLLLLVAVNAFLTLAAPTPDASPEAQPELVPVASPDALAEALPVADPLKDLEESYFKEADLEERAAPPAKQCPVCPAILKQELAPFAGVPLAKEYCASTDSKNPALQNFENLLVKNKDLFCCCLFPGGISTTETTRSIAIIQPNTTIPTGNMTIPIPPKNNSTNTTTPNPMPGNNSTNTTMPKPPNNTTNTTMPNPPAKNCTKPKKGKGKHHREGPGLFRRMWRSWTGEPAVIAQPITLVEGMPVEAQAPVPAPVPVPVQEPMPEGPRRIGGGSLRHRGVSLKLESAPGVGLSLTLEIPDISLPEAL